MFCEKARIIKNFALRPFVRLARTLFEKQQFAVVPLGKAFGTGLYNARYLSTLGDPKTVIDVGVGYGTPPLYESYPGAHFVLIEPLREFADAMRTRMQSHSHEIHFTAVGERHGSITIDVNPIKLQHSSIVHRTELSRSSTELQQRDVGITTLDKLCLEDRQLDLPILLKIDVEGNELNVLRGAQRLLRHTRWVIVEVSVAERFLDSYSFEDIVLFMANKGFNIHSFLSIEHKCREARPRFVDVVFTSNESHSFTG